VILLLQLGTKPLVSPETGREISPNSTRDVTDARPYISADEYSNIIASFPSGALPSKGDIVQIDGIKHPLGSFVVSSRVFQVSSVGLYAAEIILGIEGM
jgi:hypothetical protein